ncbi:MAG: DUF488 family protein [Candidatus Binataceae bacterium]
MTQLAHSELFTIGHSTHPIERFIDLLRLHGIAVVADVRSFPGSRRWPQFNQESLESSLRQAGIDYRWLKLLGGRRHLVNRDSPHIAWNNAAFRSYADYMDSDEFREGLENLIQIARYTRVAVMCSEGLWWRCHRRIISDNLVIRGWDVMHIMPDGKLTDHRRAEFASVLDGRLLYDGGQSSLQLK